MTKYRHKEAFALMWYECRNCDHKERMWNSRDGVTPFGTTCPSCGLPDLMHVAWHLDVCEPNYRPRRGQRVWIDMTEAHASAIADRNLQKYPERLRGITREQLVESYLSHPGEPFLAIAGYDHAV